MSKNTWKIFCLLDIDKFKSYNNYLGYDKADKKLRQLAELFINLQKSAKNYKGI